jgi:outer membrane protein assembly factor BamD (BamD/ComL family)
MQQQKRMLIVLASILLGACTGHPDKRTLAELHRVEPDMTEVQISNGLDEAMRGYRRFLEASPESALTPEAMRRLADLKLEKEYGIFGASGDLAAPRPNAAEPSGRLAAPVRATPAGSATDTSPAPAAAAPVDESERAFEQRAAARDVITAEPAASGAGSEPLPGGRVAEGVGPREAIALYDKILARYPDYPHNDRVLYQKARAWDELGRPDDAIAVSEQLIARYPHSRHIDEVQFRRAEYFFTRRRYIDAEAAYAAITARGAVSDFYELALYKLGWTLYKQELHEEALHQYIALLDHKVSTGYDFDQSEDQDAGRRIADTFRVVSLSFSSIGGPDAVTAYFGEYGNRRYEDRVYRHLGEFYFEKLRYQDAAGAYEAFVALHPQHRNAPHFGVRVIEIYEAGGFPQLVLASKKDFAERYGIGADYWQHVPIDESPEVVAHLKANLRDLANYYHAAYQDPERAETAPESFEEAQRWYRSFLASFGGDVEAPGIHRQLADLLLEHGDFGEAAFEFERTAYDYPPHDQAAEAGYAAIYAHREHQESASVEEREAVRRAAVASTLRFVDTYPSHEHAAVVLGAAVDDLYEMEQYSSAIDNGRRLIEVYPSADAAIVRSAWLAIAHSAFGIYDYPQAERAYSQVLEATAADDASRQSVVDNLAASIYQQGEQATAADDLRAAAGHFLRIAQVAPGSAIRPVAEYDAGAALIRLEDWDGAVSVLDAFRETHPEHELLGQATKQLAHVYREQGKLDRAAVEYERIASEAPDDEVRREALLVAGELYRDAGVPDRAIEVYRGYVERYPEPLELALETRFEIAALHEGMGDVVLQQAELRRIVAADRAAGAERTDRIRVLAARSALVLTEEHYVHFAEAALVQPFARSLKEKKRRMDVALAAFGRLVEYEVGEVTAAATFYVAETYREFSSALMNSERPADLGASDLLEYELALEEEAFPFEEKAIEVHEKNLELMASSVYNRWIEKSLAQLAELMPGRYAKFEESSGLIASIDRYAYDAPKPIAEEGGEVSPVPSEERAPVEPSAEPDLDSEPSTEPDGLAGADVAGW